MTSTFAPDLFPDGISGILPGGGDGPDGNLNEDPAKDAGGKQIFLYNPYNRNGDVIFYNWIGVNKSGFEGKLNTKKGSGLGGPPGYKGRIFQEIPTSKFKTPIPNTYHGWHEKRSGGNVDPPHWVHVSGMDKVHFLFEHRYDGTYGNDGGSVDKSKLQRWEMTWSGKYTKGSGGKWYQFFNAHFYNTSTTVYPFATKGISFSIRVPITPSSQGENECSIDDFGGNSKKNYGNHMQINKAYGLWVDIDGNYYVYELHCHGDNRFLAAAKSDKDEEGEEKGDDDSENASKPRPKEGTAARAKKKYPGRVNDQVREWWGERYFFLDINSEPRPIETTSSMLQDNVIKRDQAIGVTMFSNEPIIEKLFFCGVSLEVHHDRSAGERRNHTYLISRVTPIPFYSPRHDRQIKAVLGEPTPLSDIKNGKRKIHFWDPPKEYYKWQDDLTFNDLEPEEDDSVPGDTVAVSAATVFVDDEGNPAAIPADVILNDEGEVILEAEGMYPLTIDEVEDSK